jgi:hypothetical protein
MTFGLSFLWSSPLFTDDLLSGAFNQEISAYSHTLGMDWGYLTADIELRMHRNDLEQWYYDGLGRDIKILNEGGIVVFRGFVNLISMDIGGISASVGPLVDVANRVLATYTARLILDNFIMDAGQTETVFVEDLPSQARYGIWEKTIQAGNCFVNPDTGYNEAEFARDAYLMQYKMPQTNFTVVPNAQESGVIRIQIVGYQEWLKAYIYQDRIFGGASPVTQTVTAKIIAALATDPNGLISTVMSGIKANAALKVDQENQYRSAYAVIEDAVKVGDGTNLWRFFIDDNLVPFFEAVSTAIKYAYHLVENRQVVFDYFTNTVVQPYDVQAGMVIYLADWLVGEYGSPGMLGEDPRVALINQVRFSAPNSLEISTVPLNQFESYINFKSGSSY